MEVNVCGTFLCMKHEIQAMLKTGGCVIAMSDAASLVTGISIS